MDVTKLSTRRCRATAMAVVATAAIVGTALPRDARAQERDQDRDRDRTSAQRAYRHTLAELELGVIALPRASISNGQGVVTTSPISGDATIQAGLHLVFRANKAWAFGAGFLWGPRPLSESHYGGRSELMRTHSRSYLTMTGEGRYFPLRFKKVDTWIGASAGVVVVSDRFVTDFGKPSDVLPPILGTREVTVRTEGFTTGLELGASYNFYNAWVVAGRFRGSGWFLPGTPACLPIGDCATLSGRLIVFELGISIGYRLPL